MPTVTGFEYESDEDYESDEGDEGDETDEFYEAAEGDEGDESDEGDEGDEGDESDERLSDESTYSDRARARQMAYERGLADAQRSFAQGARDTQSDLSRRFRSIRGAAPVQLRPTGRLIGNDIVTAELPNGRRTKMRLTPTLATVRDVNALTARIQSNDKRQAQADRVNSAAINRLSAAQDAAVKQLTAQQVKNTSMLTKSIAKGNAQLDKRITFELSDRTGIAAKQRRDLTKRMNKMHRRYMWDAITLGTALPFFVAYGDRQNPFGKNNLILTGSLVGWLMFDEILDQLMGAKPGKGGSWSSSISDGWSYLAPIGNAATAYFLFRNDQHQRFVAGQSTITGNGSNFVTIPVAPNQAKLSGNAAIATVISGPAAVTGIKANVQGGQINLQAIGAGAADQVTVAWIVDTHTPTATQAPTTTPSTG